MSGFITALADRALELVAPKATASACIPPDPWDECDYIYGVGYLMHCSYACDGTVNCYQIGWC